MFISNLVYILKYAGLIGFIVVFFVPITFQLSSQWLCYNTFGYMVVDENNKICTPCKEISKNELELKGMNVTEESEEESLLPENMKQQKQVTIEKVFDYFFSCKNTFLYTTPYSTFMGHPLCVLFILLLAVICFILTIVSLFMHPSVTSCQ